MIDDAITLPELALSVRQPWAWAIVSGFKDIENRSPGFVRHGLHLGPICIHASKGMTQREYEETRAFMASIGVGCPDPAELIRGGIIGTVVIDNVVHEHDSKWFFGPRGLVLEQPEPLVTPIPSSGQLGFFHWERGGELAEPSRWMTRWSLSPDKLLDLLDRA